MEIKKTVGHPKLDFFINGKKRKGYAIHTTCGEKYHAKPVGSQSFECGGINFKSLKALKAHIEAGGFDTEAPDEHIEDRQIPWDCPHPCSLLIVATEPYCGFYTDLIKLTLDAYGWLDCMGRPDVARAEREIKRVENLKKDQNSY